MNDDYDRYNSASMYNRALCGDPVARTDCGLPPLHAAPTSPLAEAWPSMSMREKITGIVGSIVVGVGGALIIAALLR